jgi:hypothetical protein
MIAYLHPSLLYTCWPEAIDVVVWVCTAINDPFVRILS